MLESILLKYAFFLKIMNNYNMKIDILKSGITNLYI